MAIDSHNRSTKHMYVINLNIYHYYDYLKNVYVAVFIFKFEKL